MRLLVLVVALGLFSACGPVEPVGPFEPEVFRGAVFENGSVAGSFGGRLVDAAGFAEGQDSLEFGDAHVEITATGENGTGMFLIGVKRNLSDFAAGEYAYLRDDPNVTLDDVESQDFVVNICGGESPNAIDYDAPATSIRVVVSDPEGLTPRKRFEIFAETSNPLAERARGSFDFVAPLRIEY